MRPLRDAARPAAADRLRLDLRADRRRGDAGLPVRGDAGLLAPRFRGRVSARAPDRLVRGSGGGLPALRWSAPRGPARQCQAAGRSPRWGARGSVQRAAARLCALLGIPGRAPVRRIGHGPRARTRTASATSRRMRSPATGSPLGRRWKRTLSDGEVADQRIHGTTGEPPIERFRREEAAALAPLMAGRRSGGCARWSGVCRRTARSISTPTTTACPGG